jgi:proteic killer suppression protein
MNKVSLSRLATKQLQKVPVVIQKKVANWIDQVIEEGIQTIRLSNGYHDEPLKGKRQGQRSVRLNKQWRLIYSEITLEIVEIQEVTPHDYRTK